MEKRKTHTSTAVKRRYNEKTYSSISIAVPKDMAAKFRDVCAERGVSQASVLKAAIQSYLDSCESDTL